MNADVTKLLRAGDNKLGAICGDGWYTGTLLWKNDRTHYEFYRHLREVAFEFRLQTLELRPKSKRRGYQLDKTLAVPFENCPLFHSEPHNNAIAPAGRMLICKRFRCVTGGSMRA